MTNAETKATKEKLREGGENAARDFTEGLKAKGYDGIITEGGEIVAFSPTQIKSVNNRGTWDPNDPRILYQPKLNGMSPEAKTFLQRAFHGSPYSFEKFMLEHIGTGEGYQAYGWGLYFASRKEIAESYRKQLSRGATPALYWNGKKYLKSENSPEWDILAYIEAAGLEAAREAAREDMAATADVSPEGYWQRVQDVLNAVKSKDEIRAERGQLYEVEIPDNDVLLEMEKPLSEQPEKVREALEKAGLTETEFNRLRFPNSVEIPGVGTITKKLYNDQIDNYDEMVTTFTLWPEGVDRAKWESGEITISFPPEPGEPVYPGVPLSWNEVRNLVGKGGTGADIYWELSNKLGSDRAASEYLNSLGIKGLRYLDGGSRAAGEGTHNFVIFDDNAIQMLDMYYQFAGQRSAMSPEVQLNLARAQELAASGTRNGAIRRETGWFIGMDGKWRYEIPDNLDGINIGDRSAWNVSLSKIYKNKALFAAYPQLKKIKVGFSDLPEDTVGQYSNTTTPALIELNTNTRYSDERLKKALLHEIQHAIQEMENFARGANPAEFQGGARLSDMPESQSDPLEQYKRVAGEIESRDTERRAGMSAEERDAISPDLREDAIVVFAGEKDLPPTKCELRFW
jgi:hypothetical protein